MNIRLSRHPIISESESIAVYGLGEIGRRLCEELCSDGIDVVYVVDRNTPFSFSHLKHYFPWEDLPPVDLMIITAVSEYNSICDSMISQRIDHFMFIENIIDELCSESWIPDCMSL